MAYYRVYRVINKGDRYHDFELVSGDVKDVLPDDRFRHYDTFGYTYVGAVGADGVLYLDAEVTEDNEDFHTIINHIKAEKIKKYVKKLVR